MSVNPRWPALPYEAWHATCDTLHAHTQVLGKLAAALARPEPQLQHAALRITARGWETLPLRAPDGSGAFVVALDLHTHHAVVEHSDGRVRRIPLAPDRPVAHVTRDVLASVGELVGTVSIDPRPQETPWSTPLDEDDDHSTYNPSQVTDYFAAATQAALVGWWPGDARSPRAAFFAFAFPTPDGFDQAILSPPAARWDAELGEYLLDWDDVRSAIDPQRAALDFGVTAIRHACRVGGWDPILAASAEGNPPPLT